MLDKKVARVALLVLAGVFCLTMNAAPQDGQSRVKGPFEKLAKARVDEVWPIASELEAAGREIVPDLQDGLKRPEAPIRLACAKALYALEARRDAVAALLTLMGEDNIEFRTAAAEVLAALVKDETETYGDIEEVASKISKLLDTAADKAVRVSFCRALYAVNRDVAAVRELKELLECDSQAVREESAIALGEMKQYEAALPMLKKMAQLPNDRGKVARMLIEQKRLTDLIMRKSLGNNKYDYPLLDEIIEIIGQRYVDPAKADLATLLTNAARGVAGGLDPYTSYLDEKEKKRLREDIEQKYGGIGAHVSTRDEWLTIERPIYSGPAYKAGLRSLDRIVEVEGTSTYGKTVEELVGKLKGQPGTKVNIKVYRRGWTDSRPFTLTREQIVIKTAKCTILPGNIGYALVESFSDTTARELADGLKMFEEKGVKGLIMDLRGNSGGYLSAAKDITDLFLKSGQVIVETRGRGGKVIDTLKSKSDYAFEVPTVILINGGSASASEIVAGAMQDYQLATLVGEKSYGKGSVQHMIDLKTTDYATTLRMTVAKWYTPKGRSIQRDKNPDTGVETGGIEPDIKIAAPELEPKLLWRAAETEKLLESGKLDEYVKAHYETNKDLFKQLVDYDAFDCGKYPGFDDFYNSLKTKADRDDVREMLRAHLRRKVSDDRSIEFLCDIESDVQLQRGITEVLGKMKVAVDSIAEYKPLVNKFDKKEEEKPK
jgi:carboxyl-terminal processing protease